MTIETKNSIPTTATILNWATVFGIALALGILAMSVGLIRSETAGDLRTLTATGASSSTRRLLTAVTAGALGLLGALLGTAAAYVAAVAYARGNSLDGLSSLPVRADGESPDHPDRHAAARDGHGLAAGRARTGGHLPAGARVTRPLPRPGGHRGPRPYPGPEHRHREHDGGGDEPSTDLERQVLAAGQRCRRLGLTPASRPARR